MRFIDINTLEIDKDNILQSNIYENVLIASKTNKRTLRTVFLTYILGGLSKDISNAEIDKILSEEANNLVLDYISRYLKDVNFEYVKDLSIEDFEFESRYIQELDASFKGIHKRAVEIINVYNLNKIYNQLLS